MAQLHLLVEDLDQTVIALTDKMSQFYPVCEEISLLLDKLKGFKSQFTTAIETVEYESMDSTSTAPPPKKRHCSQPSRNIKEELESSLR
jgi:hypothetical protein